jgi:hypothetical protein
VSVHPGPGAPLPMGRLCTLGIRFFVGRCHAAALLPEVMGLIAVGRLYREAVTTRVVDWDAAPEAWLEPAPSSCRANARVKPRAAFETPHGQRFRSAVRVSAAETRGAADARPGGSR